MGHDVVAWLTARRPQDKDKPPPLWGEVTDKTAPQGVNLIMARDKADLAGLLRGLEPDLALCWGFGWKIPQEALDVPRHGIVNQHPAPLPRFRGPSPMSWAIREGDNEFFITWHRMDAELDTGQILSPKRRADPKRQGRDDLGDGEIELLHASSSGSRPAIPGGGDRRRVLGRVLRGGLLDDRLVEAEGRRSTTRCARGTYRSTAGRSWVRSRSSTASGSRSTGRASATRATACAGGRRRRRKDLGDRVRAGLDDGATAGLADRRHRERAAEALIGQLHEMGHDVVAWLMQRRPQSRDLPPPPWGETSDKTAPQGVNLIWVRDKADLAPLLRGLEPDVVLCWGFSWKIPQEALEVPHSGAVNQHPALLPRHRGPVPLSWALREGDNVFGITWHRMDAELDTGPILAQTSIPILEEETSIRRRGRGSSRRPGALLPQRRRAAHGPRPRRPGNRRGRMGRNLEEDYATIDWSAADGPGDPDQVRGWARVRPGPDAGPLRGARRRAREGAAHEPHRPGRRLAAVDTADGKIWVLESEPFETDPSA